MIAPHLKDDLPWTSDNGIGFNLAEETVFVIPGRSSGPVAAEELVVCGQLIPRPPFLALPVSVLSHSRVLHESHVPTAFHQTSEKRVLRNFLKLYLL